MNNFVNNMDLLMFNTIFTMFTYSFTILFLLYKFTSFFSSIYRAFSCLIKVKDSLIYMKNKLWGFTPVRTEKDDEEMQLFTTSVNEAVHFNLNKKKNEDHESSYIGNSDDVYQMSNDILLPPFSKNTYSEMEKNKD